MARIPTTLRISIELSNPEGVTAFLRAREMVYLALADRPWDEELQSVAADLDFAHAALLGKADPYG